MVCDAYTGSMLFWFHYNLDIEIRNIFREIHIADLRLIESSALLTIFIGHTSDNFQFLIRIAADHTKNGGYLDTLLSTRIRYRYALDILDHVPGAVHCDARRHLSQESPGLGCRISDRNRLRTAHRRNQLRT